jgi:hypothetical protein
MWFEADYSETMEVFFDGDGLNNRPSLHFPVSCLWSGECAGTRALCGMAFWDKISHPDSTKLPHTHHCATRWCSTSLGSAGMRVPRQGICRKMDRQRQFNALASTFTRLNTTGFFSCGVISRAVCSEHRLADLMTWRPVSGMWSELFQWMCSTEHGNNSNIAWSLSVLPREPTSRSTEVSKNLPEFRCNLP